MGPQSPRIRENKNCWNSFDSSIKGCNVKTWFPASPCVFLTSIHCLPLHLADLAGFSSSAGNRVCCNLMMNRWMQDRDDLMFAIPNTWNIHISYELTTNWIIVGNINQLNTVLHEEGLESVSIRDSFGSVTGCSGRGCVSQRWRISRSQTQSAVVSRQVFSALPDGTLLFSCIWLSRLLVELWDPKLGEWPSMTLVISSRHCRWSARVRPKKRCVLSDWGLESLRFVLFLNGQMDPDGLVYTNCARWGSLFLRLAYLDMPWYDHLSLPAILWLKSNDKFDHIAPFSSWPSWELPMPATTYSHSIHWPWWCS